MREWAIVECTVTSIRVLSDCGADVNSGEGDATKDFGVNEILELCNCGLNM